MELGKKPSSGSIYLVTGDFGAGKSVFCQQTAARLSSSGLRVEGVLSPGRFTDGQKTGFWCENIATGERRLMASKIPGEIDGDPLDMWTFDPGVVAWGNSILAGIVQTDILLIDEIGPLEFVFGRGWLQAFNALDGAEYKHAIVVIRPNCIPLFQQHGYTYGVLDWQLETAREGWFRSL